MTAFPHPPGSENTWSGSPDSLAATYVRHCETLRGALRHALVARAVLAHLPDRPCTVLDVGGGAGDQAIVLARAGHTVTVLEPDPAMAREATARTTAEGTDVAARTRVVIGAGEEAAVLVGGGFDAVLCHGVLMYVEDPVPLLAAVTAAAAPDGLVSFLAKNASVLAMRPALEGRWADALAAVDRATETGNLGVESRGVDRGRVTARLAELGAAEEAWYGVRVFSDHLRDAPVGPDWNLILEAEWRAGTRDPYRQVARLWHLIGRRGPA